MVRPSERFSVWATALGLCLGLMLPAVPAVVRAETVSINIPADKTHRMVSVVVTKGLTSTAKLPTPALREARKRMLKDQPVTPDELRALADRADGLAALKYVRLLVESKTATPSDIAYYGMVAVSTGRVWPLPDVVDALRKLDPATEPAARVKAYAATLYPYAWAGNSLALDAVIDLNGPGKLFGEMSKATRDKIMAQGEKDKDGRVALRLALMLAQKPDRSPADVALAQHFLSVAQASDNLQVQATATTLADVLKNNDTPMVAKE